MRVPSCGIGTADRPPAVVPGRADRAGACSGPRPVGALHQQWLTVPRSPSANSSRSRVNSRRSSATRARSAPAWSMTSLTLSRPAWNRAAPGPTPMVWPARRAWSRETGFSAEATCSWLSNSATHFASRLPQVSPDHRCLKPVQEGALLEHRQAVGQAVLRQLALSNGSLRHTATATTPFGWPSTDSNARLP